MDTEWVSIDDFSPGIYGDLHTGVTSSSAPRGSIAKNGAATIDGTYRCCSDPAGALVPLPARGAAATNTLAAITPGATTIPTFYPTGQQSIYILDALVGVRFVDDTTIPAGGSADAENVAVAYAFNYSTAGTGVYGQYFIGRLYERWRAGTPSLDFFFAKGNIQPPPASMVPNAVLSFGLGSTAGNSRNLVMTVNPAHPLMAMRGGAISAADLLLTTFETDNTNGANYVQHVSGGTFFDNSITWPQAANAALPTAESLFPISTTYKMWNLLGHQGRIVGQARSSTSGFRFGDATAMWVDDSFIRYSAVHALNGTPISGRYGEENFSGVGCMASLSADELLIVHNHGGGFLIRGDLSNPTVVKLPYIESTYGVQVHPVVTPLGLIYATRNGIFGFAGGDTSKKLSTQIEGFFFRHEQDQANEQYIGYRGRMEWWHPWVMVPNNYMMDSRTGSWWRLDTVNVPYSLYQTVPSSGKLYAFPYKLTTNDSTVWDTYDPTVMASSYQWNSQPLVESRDRLRSYQTVRVIAAPGPHTNLNQIAVTLTGIAQNGSVVSSPTVTMSFTATDDDCRPVMLQAQIKPNFVAMWTQVAITAVAAAGAAPKIMQLSLGTADRNRADRITT